VSNGRLIIGLVSVPKKARFGFGSVENCALVWCSGTSVANTILCALYVNCLAMFVHFFGHCGNYECAE